MFNKKKRKIMNKSAVFWFEFFFIRFGPGPSSVEFTKYPWDEIGFVIIMVLL